VIRTFLRLRERSSAPYRNLDPEKIVETVIQLRNRIHERFPGSGLCRVAEELLAVAQESVERSRWIAQPQKWFRASAAFMVLILLCALLTAILKLNVETTIHDVGSLLQAFEAGINDVVLVGAAIYFLVTLEERLKRKVVLKAMHELRSLAHIVDTHQLTKDPDRIINRTSDTASSPKRLLGPSEMARYLDYCSEMFSLIGKLAALHIQAFDDSAALEAVDNIEDLTVGLSRKVWQKIALLNQTVPKNGVVAPD